LKIPGTANHALAELAERGCVEVIVTTNLGPPIVTAFPARGSRGAHAEALPRSQAFGIAAMGVIVAQGIALVAVGAAAELAVSARWPGRRLR
jgi:hypothetical protein